MNQQPATSLRSLDPARALAMLLGVALHALIPYLETPVPHLLWPVREPSGAAWLDGLYWWIHGFRVPLFFLIAGMFACASLERHGAREFLKRRAWRLGGPLVLATFTVVFPAMYLVWAWGWNRGGLAEPRHVMHVRFGHGMQQDLYGFAHLWFIEYLIIYSVMLCVWKACVRRPLLAGLVGGIAKLPLGCVLLAVPTAGLLWVDARPLLEFHNWFWPRMAEFGYHGWFFVVGVALQSSGVSLERMTRGWWAELALSVPAFMVMWWLLPAVRGDGAGDAERAVFAAGAAVFAWASIWGWMGCFVWAIRPRGRIVDELVASAYWVYVTHPVVVGLVQVVLYKQPLAGWAKGLIALLAAIVVCVALRRSVWLPLGAWARRRFGEWGASNSRSAERTVSP